VIVTENSVRVSDPARQVRAIQPVWPGIIAGTVEELRVTLPGGAAVAPLSGKRPIIRADIRLNAGIFFIAMASTPARKDLTGEA